MELTNDIVDYTDMAKYAADPVFDGLSENDKVYVLEFVPEMPTTVRNLWVLS